MMVEEYEILDSAIYHEITVRFMIPSVKNIEIAFFSKITITSLL